MATGIGNLPYVMPAVSPFDTITAQETNERIANIEAVADGTGIGDKAVTLAKINGGTTAGVFQTDTSGNVTVSAPTLGYAQITSNFTTTSTSQVQVTGLTVTVTIPAGGRRVKITAFARDVYNGSVSYNVLGIWDGAVGSGTLLSAAQNGSAANNSSTLMAVAVGTPAPGSKTYNVGLNCSAGTAQLDAAAIYPAFILVELI